MKFAHIADCHIGAWRDPKLKDMNTSVFKKALDRSIQEKVDFVIIAGDLFNTSFPRLDNLKDVVLELKKLKDLSIPVYIVPGSHDYSPSGKTMLDVLEHAGLFTNVFKGQVQEGKLHLNFTTDQKTGIHLTGMLGKYGALERTYYEQLSKEHLETKQGNKIFIFHSGLEEFKPKGMENVDLNPLSLLPKQFDYYAGGHVHTVFTKQEPQYGMIAYPGPLFPNSFSELEKLKTGGFYIVEDFVPQWIPLTQHPVISFSIDAQNKDAVQVQEELDKITDASLANHIVLIRISGMLTAGKPSDINYKELYDALYEKGAYFIMRNTSKFTSKEFEELTVKAESIEGIEQALIEEHIGHIQDKEESEHEKKLIQSMMNTLSTSKQEGETSSDYNKRLKEEGSKVLNINLRE